MQTNVSVNYAELNLPFEASSIMNFHEEALFQVGNKLVVGYLADDDDCENPLESCDGQGKVYSAHRHSRTHSDMQEALALDSNWEPDLGLLDEHLDRLRPLWINAAVNSSEFIEWANETAGPRASRDEAYYRRRAQKLWRETGGEYVYGESCIDNFEFTDDVKIELWKVLRSEGLIGNQDAVALDCYDHGGQVWSLTGHGMQCRFDTAVGGGVWVPDDCAREEIERRAAIYAFGHVDDNGSWTRASGKKRYFAVLDEDYGSEHSEDFKEWHEAFQWLEGKTKSLKPKRARSKAKRAAQERLGRERAAREIAASCLEEYNAWLAGSCYGIVAATFENVSDDADEPQWNFVESDECWGFIGSDYAIEEATSNAKSIAEALEKESA